MSPNLDTHPRALGPPVPRSGPPTYDRIDRDEARDMWLAGYRCSSIARHFGVSHQAVEQTRDRYPEAFPPRDWTTVQQAARAADVQRATLVRWLADGLIPTSPDGLVKVVDIEGAIVELWTRPCQYPDCTEEVEDTALSRRFCAEHTVEVRRYAYPVLNDEQRRRWHEASNRWKAEHPERAREINLRAGRAFRARQREKAS